MVAVIEVVRRAERAGDGVEGGAGGGQLLRGRGLVQACVELLGVPAQPVRGVAPRIGERPGAVGLGDPAAFGESTQALAAMGVLAKAREQFRRLFGGEGTQKARLARTDAVGGEGPGAIVPEGAIDRADAADEVARIGGGGGAVRGVGGGLHGRSFHRVIAERSHLHVKVHVHVV